MYDELLWTLFGQDHHFLRLRVEGIPHDVREAMAAFWSQPDYERLGAELKLAVADWDGLVASLEGLGSGKVESGDSKLWLDVAKASEALTGTQPVAGALVAMQAMGAWVGGMGEHLFFQPWGGHHPGWHAFPLIAARNLVAAEAIWSARYLCRVASEFVESAKEAPFEPALRRVIADYESILAQAERIRDSAVAELAWALRANAGAERESFRAELAALFWTAGDVPHANLLGASGAGDYVPTYAIVRNLVDYCLRVIPREPLIQYIWLDMKDRGPFDLRRHHVLFGRINSVFPGHPLHQLETMSSVPLGRTYAKVAIGAMCDRVLDSDRDELFRSMALIGPLVEMQAPAVFLRIASLTNIISHGPSQELTERWRSLARMAASILRWADRKGIYEPFQHVLDMPFYALAVDSPQAAEEALDAIEAYRQANLDYWLLISPPAVRDAKLDALLREEQDLLRELRGARFIRLLPHLPAHYRRYGFNLDEALPDLPKGAGASPDEKRPVQFEPFDQNVAIDLLDETHKALEELHQRMRAIAPGYAESRIKPPSTSDDFVSALSAHRSQS